MDALATLEEIVFCETIPAAAKPLFWKLWQTLGYRRGVIKAMTVPRLATLCGMSEGQIRDRLKSLYSCGLAEREEIARGEFDLHVYQPFAPPVPKPKKLHDEMPLLSYAEQQSGNQRENPSDFQSGKQGEMQNGGNSTPLPTLQTPHSTKPPQNAEISLESRETAERLEKIRRENLKGRYNPAAKREISVVATCRKQGRNVMTFLRDSIFSFLHALSPPSLLPPPASE